MKYILLFSVLLLCSLAGFAQTPEPTPQAASKGILNLPEMTAVPSLFQALPVRLREIDGSPNVASVATINVPNGSLACSGSNCTLTYATSSGVPGGSNTQVQFNQAGAFGGISGATSDGTNMTFGSANLRATRPRFTTSIDDSNGNEIFILTASASAVNELTIANSGAGAGPSVTASGSDTDIPIRFIPKGSAGVYISGTPPTAVPLYVGTSINYRTLGTMQLQRGNGTTTFPGLVMETSNDSAAIGLTFFSGILFGYQRASSGNFAATDQRFGIHTGGIRLVAANVFGWSPSTDASVAADTGLGRGAGAVTQFNNGTTGAGSFSAVATTPAQITADQNNYNPGGSGLYQRWSSDATRSVTGLVFTSAQVDGQTHVICNVGANQITLVNQSASSTAGNRFLTTTGADLAVTANKCADVWYDLTTARWRAFLRN